MIEGIFGKPGAGKTYEAVRRILVHADAGDQCYSVTPINHPNVMTIEFEDIIDPWLAPGWILCDEIHGKLPASASRNLDPKWYEKLSQTRKDAHHLIYTSQNHGRVLKQLRDNTNWGWVCNAWGGWRGHPALFTARGYEMDRFGARGPTGKPNDRYAHLFSQRVANAFDTRYAIKFEAAVIPSAGRGSRPPASESL